MQPNNIRQEFYLFGCVLAMSSVDLFVNMSCVYEKNFLSVVLQLSLVEEPESHGKSNGVEEVRADSDNDVHGPVLNESPSDFQLRSARVCCGIGHYKSRATFLAKSAIENLNPKIVCVVSRGEIDWITWIAL